MFSCRLLNPTPRAIRPRTVSTKCGSERPKRTEPSGPRSQTIYLLEKETSATGPEKVVLKPVTVKVGISDGANTEVLEGLKEGDMVVVGTVSSAASAAGPANPFSSPFGGPGRR